MIALETATVESDLSDVNPRRHEGDDWLTVAAQIVAPIAPHLEVGADSPRSEEYRRGSIEGRCLPPLYAAQGVNLRLSLRL